MQCAGTNWCKLGGSQGQPRSRELSSLYSAQGGVALHAIPGQCMGFILPLIGGSLPFIFKGTRAYPYSQVSASTPLLFLLHLRLSDHVHPNSNPWCCLLCSPRGPKTGSSAWQSTNQSHKLLRAVGQHLPHASSYPVAGNCRNLPISGPITSYKQQLMQGDCVMFSSRHNPSWLRKEDKLTAFWLRVQAVRYHRGHTVI